MNNVTPTPLVPTFTIPRSVNADRPKPRRLPGLSWLDDGVRGHLVALLGEFAGTFLFLFFAFTGTQVANMSSEAGNNMSPDPGVLLYIALAFGFSLAVNAWVFFRISGGLFNPAVTLALCLVGAVTPLRGVIIGIAQVVGSIAAAAVVSGLFPGPLLVRTTLSSNPKTSLERGVFIEMFLTSQLIFTIFMLAAEKHKGTFLAPIGIGLALFIAELAGVYWTGGSLNPARSFGPEVVVGSFRSNHWVYWVGPFLGAILAVGFYRLVKILEYETANPGQDNDGTRAVPASHDGTSEDPNLDIPRENYFIDDASAFPVPPRSFNASSNSFIRGRPAAVGNYTISGQETKVLDSFKQSPLAERGDMPKMQT